MTIAERLAGVRHRIAAAAAAAGRAPTEITLIAVSKRMPAGEVREAYAAGQRDFGENYVQELVAKARDLEDLAELRWHLIGHLQRNKARQVVGVASSVATLDGVELVAELGRRAATRAVPPARRLSGGGDGRLVVLAEVNIGGEPDKSGCAPAELGPILDAIEHEPALQLRGLMAVPPYTEDPAAAQPYFERLVALREAHGGAARLPALSMGMTHDLEIAIAAGATEVRVGTAIFGERPPLAARAPLP